MRCCHSCSEPGTILCQLSRVGFAAENHLYCYIHAVESGLVHAPVDELRTVATQAGYSVNALIFVMEAISATQHLRNSSEVCSSVVIAARKQFGISSTEVFRHWNIRERADIGTILKVLVHAGYAPELDWANQDAFDGPFTLLDVLDMVSAV